MNHESRIGQETNDQTSEWDNLANDLTQQLPYPERKDGNSAQRNSYYRDTRAISKAFEIAHTTIGRLNEHDTETFEQTLGKLESKITQCYAQTVHDMVGLSFPNLAGYGHVLIFSLDSDRSMQQAIEADRQHDLADAEIARLKTASGNLKPWQFKEIQEIRAQIETAEQAANHWQTETFKNIRQQYVFDTAAMSKNDYDEYLTTVGAVEPDDPFGVTMSDRGRELDLRYLQPQYRNLTEYVNGKSAKTYDVHRLRSGEMLTNDNNSRIGPKDVEVTLEMLAKAKTEAAELEKLRNLRTQLSQKTK